MFFDNKIAVLPIRPQPLPAKEDQPRSSAGCSLVEALLRAAPATEIAAVVNLGPALLEFPFAFVCC